jgi:hypothetical protein
VIILYNFIFGKHKNNDFVILQVKGSTVVFFKQLLDHFPNSNTKNKKLTEKK